MCDCRDDNILFADKIRNIKGEDGTVDPSVPALTLPPKKWPAGDLMEHECDLIAKPLSESDLKRLVLENSFKKFLFSLIQELNCHHSVCCRYGTKLHGPGWLWILPDHIGQFALE